MFYRSGSPRSAMVSLGRPSLFTPLCHQYSMALCYAVVPPCGTQVPQLSLPIRASEVIFDSEVVLGQRSFACGKVGKLNFTWTEVQTSLRATRATSQVLFSMSKTNQLFYEVPLVIAVNKNKIKNQSHTAPPDRAGLFLWIRIWIWIWIRIGFGLDWMRDAIDCNCMQVIAIDCN